MRTDWQCYSTMAAITPSDTAILSPPALALLITGSGTLKIDTPGSTGVTFTPAANTIYPIQATRVYATGTAATGIFALS